MQYMDQNHLNLQQDFWIMLVASKTRLEYNTVLDQYFSEHPKSTEYFLYLLTAELICDKT